MSKYIDSQHIADVVSSLSRKANLVLREDAVFSFNKAIKKEKNSQAKQILKILLENAHYAKANNLAMCQDTGLVIVFISLGQDVRIKGGYVQDKIQESVQSIYKSCFFRDSVAEPITRQKSNASGVFIHWDVAKGDKIDIKILIKGFGSENAGSVKMFYPTADRDEIIQWIVRCVEDAGGRPCPPVFLGVGIGGTQDVACVLAKQALTERMDRFSELKNISGLEKQIFSQINKTGIGPLGLGGRTTCLGVRVKIAPTHIAGLPVALQIGCHALRGCQKTI